MFVDRKYSVEHSPALVITDMNWQVQFMYWRDQFHIYLNDTYYSRTLGLDGTDVPLYEGNFVTLGMNGVEE